MGLSTSTMKRLTCLLILKTREGLEESTFDDENNSTIVEHVACNFVACLLTKFGADLPLWASVHVAEFLQSSPFLTKLLFRGLSWSY